MTGGWRVRRQSEQQFLDFRQEGFSLSFRGSCPSHTTLAPLTSECCCRTIAAPRHSAAIRRRLSCMSGVARRRTDRMYPLRSSSLNRSAYSAGMAGSLWTYAALIVGGTVLADVLVRRAEVSPLVRRQLGKKGEAVSRVVLAENHDGLVHCNAPTASTGSGFLTKPKR